MRAAEQVVESTAVRLHAAVVEVFQPQTAADHTPAAINNQHWGDGKQR